MGYLGYFCCKHYECFVVIFCFIAPRSILLNKISFDSVGHLNILSALWKAVMQRSFEILLLSLFSSVMTINPSAFTELKLNKRAVQSREMDLLASFNLSLLVKILAVNFTVVTFRRRLRFVFVLGCKQNQNIWFKPGKSFVNRVSVLETLDGPWNYMFLMK